jgi:Zn-dependent peptidase ImmA (M78 family)/transcriptional regulator with XRE-family HTH domain
MPLAGELKKIRLRNRLSLQQVADAVGVSKPHIWEIESGRSNASLDLVLRLANHFKVSITALLGEKPGAPETLVFGREFNSASEDVKRQIIEMAERLLDDDALRIKLADLGSPEALANGIVEHYGPALAIPIPVQNIAEAVGILEVNPLSTRDFEGLLITDADKTKGTIMYNVDSILERRRFTIAHEIGHFLLPFHGARAQCARADFGILRSADQRRAREAEANRFAAALLLPEKQFRADIRRLGKLEINHISNLSRQYQTSKEATARRYTQLADDPCAIVFSREGQIRSYCKSDNFPRITAMPKQSLPSGCLSIKTAMKQLPSGTISNWTEVDVNVWLENSDQVRGKALYEQCLQQANGYRLTMLTLDSVDEDEIEEEDDLGALEALFRK